MPASDRARIVATAQRSPNRRTDGTATWQLSTLQRPLRRASFPTVGTNTIRRVLQDAGSFVPADAHLVSDGDRAAKAQGGRGDRRRPADGSKKGLIELAYHVAEGVGIPVWCQDEAGPYQAIPRRVVPIALSIVILQVWGSYRLIANTFKWLALALLAYVGAALFARPDPLEVLRSTFVPTLSLDKTFLSTVVAILGTTISPYMFFWQSDQEVEEEIQMGRVTLRARQGATDAELKYGAWDNNIGMLLSNAVMYFIILATAATLFKTGQTNIQSAADAAVALEPLAGSAAKVLLAVGLIGAGFLAVPILTGSAAYATAEALGWKFGLSRRPGSAKPFYGVIVMASLVGMLINFIGINPIDALFWTAVLNGLLAPPLLVLIMLVANSKRVMGKHTNGRWINLVGLVATDAMFAAAAGLVLTWGLA